MEEIINDLSEKFDGVIVTVETDHPIDLICGIVRNYSNLVGTASILLYTMNKPLNFMIALVTCGLDLYYCAGYWARVIYAYVLIQWAPFWYQTNIRGKKKNVLEIYSTVGPKWGATLMRVT